MADTFQKYCHKTMEEIYLAANNNNNNNNNNNKALDAEKLVSKALQFFPNLKLAVEEVKRTTTSVISTIIIVIVIIFIIVWTHSLDGLAVVVVDSFE